MLDNENQPDHSSSGTITLKLWRETIERREVLCRDFASGIYQDCFPHADQTEDADTWLPLMGPIIPTDKPHVFIILACQPDGTIIGGIVFEHYRTCGDWLATYICVAQAYRGQGIGRLLFGEMTTVIADLAAGESWNLYAEAECPDLVPEADQSNAYARLPMLDGLGLQRLPIDYIQPALGSLKSPVCDLMLLSWSNQLGTNTKIESARVGSFLRAFYRSLPPYDEQALRHMLDQLADAGSHLVPERLTANAAFDRTLGSVSAITLKLTFLARFDPNRLATADRGPSRHGQAQAETVAAASDTFSELPFSQLIPHPEREKVRFSHWQRLLESFSSYHNDITIPFASAGSLPIILQCQPFRNPHSLRTGEVPPLPLRVVYPSVLVMNWEDEDRTTHFVDPSRPEWSVDAHLVDCVAIFESGYVGYSVALVFDNDSSAAIRLNAAALLAITSLAKPAGTLKGEPVKFAFGDETPKPAHEFLQERIKRLADPEVSSGGIFSALVSPAEMQVSVRDRLKRAFRAMEVWRKHENDAPSVGERLKQNLLTMRFPDPSRQVDVQSTRCTVSLEIIGSEYHDAILRIAEEATARRAPVDQFTRRLAGLAQNVIDFDNQDASEVYDSLAGGHRLGDDQTFVHRDLAIRFSRSSRAYDDMQYDIGGEPYWFLVELVVAHNGKLLIDLNDDIRRQQGTKGLGATMRELLNELGEPLRSEKGRKSARVRLEEAQHRRITLAHYIPNIFRYPTEKSLYDMFVMTRGLALQMDYFLRREATMEQMLREIAVLNAGIAHATDDEANESRNKWLMTIGVVQAIGVGAAFASLFASLGTFETEDVQSLSAEMDLAVRHVRSIHEYLVWLFEPWSSTNQINNSPVHHPVADWALLMSFSLLWSSIAIGISVPFALLFRRPGALVLLFAGVILLLYSAAQFCDSSPRAIPLFCVGWCTLAPAVASLRRRRKAS